jgi:K+-transporting ATPase KdpF subunit
MKLSEDLIPVWTELNRRKLPRCLFWALCANLLLAPAVYAAADGFSRSQAYALGILGIVTAVLSAYLFVVMFQPEKF